MRILPPARLITLTEAFNRIGAGYIEGWDGSERAVASLGQRSRGSFPTWRRAREAMRLTELLVRDGTLGMVAYDDRGGRLRYYEASLEVISMLLLPPDESSAGLVEFHSGKTMTCEIDISTLNLQPVRQKRPGRKPKYVRCRELVEAALKELGPKAPNADVKNYVLNHLESAPYPSARSTVNEIIDRAREKLIAGWVAQSIPGHLPAVPS